jgi:hypothetical protein
VRCPKPITERAVLFYDESEQHPGCNPFRP